MNPNDNQQGGEWPAAQPQPQPQPEPTQQPQPAPQPDAQFAPQPSPVATDVNGGTQDAFQQPQQDVAVNPFQPVAPIAPVEQAAPQVPLAPQPPQPKKNKLLILIAAIAGGLLLIGGAIFAAFMIFIVTPGDYEKANDVMKTVNTSYNGLKLTGDVTVKTEEDRKKRIEEVRTKYETFTKDVNTLAAQKAVKRDGEAAELYSAVAAKREKFDAMYVASLEVIEYIAPAMMKASDTKTVDSIATELKEHQSKIKDADNKAYVEKLIPFFERYAALAKKVDAMKTSGKYDAAVIREASTLNTELSSATKLWQEAQTKKTDDSNMQKELKALADYLAKKV